MVGSGLRKASVLEVLHELQVLEELDVPEVMRCVLLCMLEAVVGWLSFVVSKFPLQQFFHRPHGPAG